MIYHRTIYFRLSVIVAGMLVAVCNSMGQVSRSAYFYDYLPVANTLNPAFTPSGEIYINLPVISSTYIGFSSPINFSDLTEKGEADDYLYIDRQGILDKLNDVNMFSFNFYSTLGQIGIKSGKHSFQIGFAKVWTTEFTFEKELIKFFLYGNASEEYLGKSVSFNKTGLNSTLYHEFAVNYAYELNSKFTFGTKIKYLNGTANVYSEKANIRLLTADDQSYSITASSDIAIHTSSAYGYLDQIGDQEMDQYLWMDFTRNHGFAFDFGVQYNPILKLKLSLSVIDLGKIYWKENVKSYISKYPGKEYTFNGIDLNDFIRDNRFIDTVPLLDSIKEHFRIEEVYDPYSSHLTPKTYLGSTYDITPKDQFGLLIKTDYFQHLTRFCYTVNYKRRLGKVFSANINYSYTGRRSNLGFGLALKAGPVNVYALSDMIPSFFSTVNARAVYFQFGICFVFRE